MLLVANQLKIKVLAVVVALALVMPMVMMPVGAAQAQENCPWAGIEYLDAEIKVIDGQPVFVYETETGYEKIPFSLSELDYAYADGQKVPMQTQGNNILIPTEEGPVAVPIEEFCVVMIDGEMMLLAEENPKFLLVVKAIAVVALKRAGVAVTWTTTKIACALIIAGKKVTPVAVSAVKGAIPKIRQALIAAGLSAGVTALWWSVTQWIEGQCIHPQCVRMTRDGSGGDIFCSVCAQRFGQFYGPKLPRL